jgi:predicted small metal-binding protein
MPGAPTTTKPPQGGKKQQTWTVDCAPECGFSVRNHNQKELVAMVQMHTKQTHNKNTPEADVLKMARSS